MTNVPRQEAVDRLAAYEDTGLTPGDVKDLQELCKENGLAKYVDLIVEAKRQMSMSNERDIEQNERIEELEAENARLRAERDKAVEDIALLVASSPTIKCSLVCNGDCLDCATSASGMPRGYKWRGTEGKA
ncbi:MAG: hypothetical protein VB049_04920 [Candidatus Pelethousia sp.]|nr:hypothetical protein [Candidatus Pelethousia sp.]